MAYKGWMLILRAEKDGRNYIDGFESNGSVNEDPTMCNLRETLVQNIFDYEELVGSQNCIQRLNLRGTHLSPRLLLASYSLRWADCRNLHSFKIDYHAFLNKFAALALFRKAQTKVDSLLDHKPD